jgi:aminoglycoside phosphotransferase (APT) family kinase protein
LPPVAAMFDPVDAAATYERISGDTLDNLSWYEAFAGLRFGIILLRMRLRSIAFGMQEDPVDPDEMIMFGPLLDRLLRQVV